MGSIPNSAGIAILEKTEQAGATQTMAVGSLSVRLMFIHDRKRPEWLD
jgi:hypothetical protein